MTRIAVTHDSTSTCALRSGNFSSGISSAIVPPNSVLGYVSKIRLKTRIRRRIFGLPALLAVHSNNFQLPIDISAVWS